MTSLRALAAYRFVGKSEQAVREEWVRPLLVHLGYGIETLNDIIYEEQFALAAPFRRIGRTRIKIDYRPTVLGHGLWIIEAKAHESEEWEEAVSQAWLYATHPEVDVPFMAIADGSRIAVYDTNRVSWDEPLIAVDTPHLENEFAHLAAILGAAHVTRAVRTRRTRHLGAAMRAEVQIGRLRDYVKDVEDMAAAARPAVLENQKAVLRDQFDAEERRQRDLIERHGLFTIGVWANRATGVPARLGGLAHDRLLAIPPDGRMAEMRRLRDAAVSRRGPDGSRCPRMMWNLRLLELFVALSIRHEAGCETLTELARQGVRDHVLNFPADDLGRAAHRLERVLPVFVARSIVANNDVDLPRVARETQAHWSDEMRLRIRMSPDRLFVRMVTDLVQRFWSQVPWTTDTLDETAAAMEAALPMMAAAPEVDGDGAGGYFDAEYKRDWLQVATLYETGALITSDLLDDEIAAALEDLAANDPDRPRVAEPAARLVALYHSGA